MSKEETKEEGPRSFSRTFELLGEGEAHSLASIELHELLKKLQGEALARRASVTGEFALTLKLSVDEEGVVTVAHNIKTKMPPRRTSRSILWLTTGANLVPENPRQQKLPLREVKGGRSEAKDVEAGRTAARDV
jgi:hypothetical protein